MEPHRAPNGDGSYQRWQALRDTERDGSRAALPAPFPQACREGIQPGSRHGWAVTKRCVFVCLEGFLHPRQPTWSAVLPWTTLPGLKAWGSQKAACDKGGEQRDDCGSVGNAGCSRPGAAPLIGPGLILCSYIATLWQPGGLNPGPSADCWGPSLNAAQGNALSLPRFDFNLWLESLYLHLRFFCKSSRIFVIYCYMRTICLKADLGMCSRKIIQLSAKTHIKLHECPRGIRDEEWFYPVPDKIKLRHWLYRCHALTPASNEVSSSHFLSILVQNVGANQKSKLWENLWVEIKIV